MRQDVSKNASGYSTVSSGKNAKIPPPTRSRLSIAVGIALCFQISSIECLAEEGLTELYKSARQPTLLDKETKNVDQAYIRVIEVTGELDLPEYGLNRRFALKEIAKLKIRLPAYLSLTDIHDIADQLAQAYREKGLTFTKISVPPQQIKRGKLVLQVRQGRLSDIKVYKNSLYSTSQLISAFEPLLNKPVHDRKIIEKVGFVSQFPGLALFGYYSRGSNENDVRLNLRVLKEEGSQHFVSFDNHGVDATSEERLTYAFAKHNPLRQRGTVTASATMTGAADSLLGLVNYNRPIRKHKINMGLQFARSQFDISGDFQQLGLSGSVTTLSANFSRPDDTNNSAYNPDDDLRDQLGESSSHSFHWLNQAGVSFNLSEISSEFIELESLEEESQYLAFSLGGEYRYKPTISTPSSGLTSQVTFGLSVGTVSQTSSSLEDDSYVTLESQWLLEKRFSGVFPNSARWSTKLLYTSNITPSAETISLSGMAGVRGYESGLFSAHSGIMNRLTLNSRPTANFFSLPIRTSHWSLYLDASYGVDNTADETSTAGNAYAGFIGVGAELNALITPKLSLNSNLAIPLTTMGDAVEQVEDSDDFDSARFYISLSYRL